MPIEGEGGKAVPSRLRLTNTFVAAGAALALLVTSSCTHATASTRAGAGASKSAKSHHKPARTGSSIPVVHRGNPHRRSHPKPPSHPAHPSKGAAHPGTAHKSHLGDGVVTKLPGSDKALPPMPATGSLSYGATGGAVSALQNRLTALGYWIGPTDGYFGDSTQQAIFALQKAAGISRDGVFGPQTRKALARAILPSPRKSKGYVIQVNLADDLLMVTRDGRLVHVLNTSTGGGYTYYDKGSANVAITPVGVFHIYSEINRLVTDSLGQLWRPKYFDSGFAIHGDGYVPPIPVSHGCVRVSNEAINWLWDSNIAPMGTEVWVYS